MLEPLPPAFGATREGLHALAEHVLAPARYRSDGHIGLVPSAGGFGTPTFGDGQRVRVEGVELVHERPGSTRRVPITTLSDAAQFVGVPLGAPTEVYKPATACLSDTALDIEAEAARAAEEAARLEAARIAQEAEAARVAAEELRIQQVNNLAAAKTVGKNIAERAKAKGITKVVFDRGGYIYHGRVKALADSAREAGLQF